jgi:hypothetical protein
MSNRSFLESVTISNNKTKEESYAIKIYDDYVTAILSVENAIYDDFYILKTAISSKDEVANGILDHIREMEKGLYIFETWYDWDEIKHLFN